MKIPTPQQRNEANTVAATPDMHGQRWTTDEMLHLAQLYIDPRHLAWDEIAQHLHRTTGACQNRLYLLKTAYTIAETVNLYEQLGLVIDHNHNHNHNHVKDNK